MENIALQEESVGLADSVNGKIDNCINEGNVIGNNYYIGGIVGGAGWYNASTKLYRKEQITNCINKGDISTTLSQVGGIAGNINYGTSILNSENYGAISGTGKDDANRSICGGIVGRGIWTGDSIIQNCKNYGEVSSEYNLCGGIAGWMQRGTISNCENQGTVTNSRSRTGGIAGDIGSSEQKTKATIENCINKGNIEQTLNGAGGPNTGGIAGFMQYGSTITQSVNIGNVTSQGYYKADTAVNKRSNTGGICGTLGSIGANTISYCYNIGNVKGNYRAIGGITGEMYLTSQKVEYCYSVGNVTGPTGVLNIGGAIGRLAASGTVNNVYYLQNTIIDVNGDAQANITAAGDSKSESEIKSITSLDIWKNFFKNDYNKQINKGFPILSWQ